MDQKTLDRISGGSARHALGIFMDYYSYVRMTEFDVSASLEELPNTDPAISLLCSRIYADRDRHSKPPFDPKAHAMVKFILSNISTKGKIKFQLNKTGKELVAMPLHSSEIVDLISLAKFPDDPPH